MIRWVLGDCVGGEGNNENRSRDAFSCQICDLSFDEWENSRTKDGGEGRVKVALAFVQVEGVQNVGEIEKQEGRMGESMEEKMRRKEEEIRRVR